MLPCRWRPVRLVGLSLVLCLVGLAPATGADPEPPKLRLKTAEFDPLDLLPAAPRSLTLEREPSSGVFIVQFDRPVAPALLAALRATGARPLKYVSDWGYLVRLPSDIAGAVRAVEGVRWLGAVQPAWKISPELGSRPLADPARRANGLLYATVDAFPGEDPETLAEEVSDAGVEVLGVGHAGPTARLRVRGSREALETLAWIGGVHWIEELGEATPRNDTTRWVIQNDVPSSTPVWDHGLHGEDQIIGHIDGRIDMSSCYFSDPVDNTPGPGHRKVVAYRSSAGLGADPHGTHTAGTAAGDQEPLSGTIAGNGMAPAAKLSHTFRNDVTGYGNTASNLYSTFAAAHADGARVHTNSWGDDGYNAYTTWCVDIDQFSYDHEDSLIVFAASNSSTLRTPENAKNVLAVGASLNGTLSDLHCFGGIGPTTDGRRKPEIYAPGCSIESAENGSACSTRATSGTSMAAPAIAGAGALVRQYFEEGWYPTGTRRAADAIGPSGALVKATLLNSTVDMVGITGYPSDLEGWGRVLIENALYFDGDTRRLAVLADVRNAAGLSWGESATHVLAVGDSDETLKITLVFTDPAAVLLAAFPRVNDLDLEVTSPSGSTYFGNVIDPGTGLSTAGGSRDLGNNVEMVILDNPEPGDWTISVVGREINEATQGYALVAGGQVSPFAGGVLRHDGHTIDDSPPLGNGDGVVDPGETITMPVSLMNSGLAAVTGVSGALTSNRADLVRITTATAVFPGIPPDQSSSSLTPDFRYTVSPTASCGVGVLFQVATLSNEGPGATFFPVDIGKMRLVESAPGLPVDIPKQTAGLVSTLDVAEPFQIDDVHVAVSIEHEDVGELVVELTSPQGTTVVLHDRSRAGFADLSAIYDLELPPDGPGSMSDLDFEPAQGTWSLTIRDLESGPVSPGRLLSWNLDLRAVSAISCTPLSCSEPVPDEIGPTLTVGAENGSDLAFDWGAVAGATGYRIWSSETPDFEGDWPVGAGSETSFLVEDGLAESTAARYYVVRAVNACEWEGP